MKRIWMSVKQLADEFGVSVDSVYRAYRNGRIPGHQMERIIRFDLEEVRLCEPIVVEGKPGYRFIATGTFDRLLTGIKFAANESGGGHPLPALFCPTIRVPLRSPRSFEKSSGNVYCRKQLL